MSERRLREAYKRYCATFPRNHEWIYDEQEIREKIKSATKAHERYSGVNFTSHPQENYHYKGFIYDLPDNTRMETWVNSRNWKIACILKKNERGYFEYSSPDPYGRWING